MSAKWSGIRDDKTVGKKKLCGICALTKHNPAVEQLLEKQQCFLNIDFNGVWKKIAMIYKIISISR